MALSFFLPVSQHNWNIVDMACNLKSKKYTKKKKKKKNKQQKRIWKKRLSISLSMVGFSKKLLLVWRLKCQVSKFKAVIIDSILEDKN